MGNDSLSTELLMNLRPLSNPAVSVEGDQIAFVVGAPAPLRGESSSTELWHSGPGGAPAVAVVAPGTSIGALAFSRDSDLLAFSQARNGELATPWVRDAAGHVIQLPVPDGAVEALSWSDDGSYLIALVADPGSDSQGAGAGTRMKGGEQEPIVRRPGEAWRRLWVLDRSTGSVRVLSPEGVNVWEFDWAGAGPIVALVSADPSESGWYDADVASIDEATGAVTTLYEASWQLQSPAIDQTASRIAFVEGFASDRTCVTGIVNVLDLATGERIELARHIDVAQVKWLADGSLFYTAVVGLNTSCGRMSTDGGETEFWNGPAMMGLAGPRAASSADGRTIVAAVDAPGSPHEFRRLDLRQKDWVALTAINADLAGYAAPSAERVAWSASDGLDIEGILLRPPGHDDGPLPLVVAIHGGPVGAHGFGFLRPTELALANAGYALLLPNPRGSAGRGQEFARGVRHDMGGKELSDTLAGIEHLRDRGVIDGDRIGITGFSHGGFISAWAPTQSLVFRASVPRGCVANWVSFHNTSNIGRWDELFLGSDPYDPSGHHFTRSPVIHARKCRTPTLVMHGELDLSAPVGQARELYQALADSGCDTELVIYPRAGHGWKEREQILDSCERMIAWFNKYLAP